MEIVKRTDPQGVTVFGLMPGSGATGTYFGQLSVHVPMNATSTANGATNWINPEDGTVAVRVQAYFTTAGTGTYDIGVSSDGTGAANGVFDGGTMSVGIHTRVGTNATAGVADEAYVLVGPGGTGTNNSIVMSHTDTPTSTAVGGLVIVYHRIGR